MPYHRRMNRITGVAPTNRAPTTLNDATGDFRKLVTETRLDRTSLPRVIGDDTGSGAHFGSTQHDLSTCDPMVRRWRRFGPRAPDGRV